MTQDDKDLQTEMILKLLEPLIMSDSFRCASISLKTDRHTSEELYFPYH